MIPSLPIELWIKIILLSLPLPSFSEVEERNSILLSLNLLNKTFNLIIKPILFSNPILEGEGTIQLFLNSLKLTGGKEDWRNKVKSLRLVRVPRSENKFLIELFQSCDQLEECFIWESGEGLSWFEYSMIKKLKSLHLYNCLIRKSTIDFYFPHLTNLSLQHLDAQLLPLTPLTAPNLTAVTLHHIIFGGDAVPNFLTRFKSQLIALVLGDKLGGLQRFDWTLLKNLKILALLPDVTRFGLRWAGINTRDFLFKFHPHLRVLHFPYIKEVGFKPFSVQSPCLEKLHTLIYKLSPQSAFNSIEKDLVWEEAKVLEKSSGVKVEWEKGISLDNHFYPYFWESVKDLKAGKFELIGDEIEEEEVIKHQNRHNCFV